MRLPKPKSIRWKVAIPIVFIDLVSGLSLGLYSYYSEINQAKRNVEDQIRVAMAFTKASREYVRGILRPKIGELLASGCGGVDFVLEAQSSSFFTASIFKDVSERLGSFKLRQVAFNPLNPKDEPSEMEAKVINFLKATNSKEYTGIVEDTTGKQFVYASAVIPDAGCLACHGKRESMPKALLERYKPQYDPNWEVGKVVGAVMVTVPFDAVLAKAQLSGLVKGLVVFSIFLGIILFLIAALNYLVFEPISKLEHKAEEIAKGNVDEPVDITSEDEIGRLAQAFERMRVSIKKVMDLLK